MPILFVLFVVVPLMELAIIVGVQRVIGLDWTLLALLGMSLAGAALVKREGIRAWQRFREALDETRLPTEEVTDGALVLVGGALMVTPGFMTDLVGLCMVMPPTRRLVNRLLRTRVRAGFGLGPAWTRHHPQGAADTSPEVIDVEVVNIQRDDPDDPAGELAD